MNAQNRSIWTSFVDGGPLDTGAGRVVDSVAPATGSAWTSVRHATVDDVDLAVRSAAKAFPAWSAMAPAARGRLLWALADAIEAAAEDLARTESIDNGKAIRESSGEIRGAADYLRYYAGLTDKIDGQRLLTRPDIEILTSREPFGVVAGITGWNSPFYQAVRKVAPATAAGNTVVLKPDENTSVTALLLAELAIEAGFPAGVVNVVPGDGPTVGHALVVHPDVRRVTLTGSVDAAAEIMRAGAEKILPLSFELGGKSAHIVFDDAALDDALVAAVNGGFGAAGQSCTAGSRIFVQQTVFDEFERRFLDLVRGLRIGDPLDPDTQIGAITCEAQLQKVERYVEIAREEGASLLLGGRRAAAPDGGDGWFFEPTIFTGCRPEMRIAREEVFGPLVTLLPFADEDDVVRAANDLPFGLTAGLWTRDLARAHRVARSLEVGMVWVNMFRSVHPSAPYGGTKLSGFGREDGVEGLLSYTQTKTTMIDLDPSHRPDLFGLRGLGIGRTTS